MIEGIRIELSAAELRAHIVTRRDFHKTKADWYQARMGALKAGSEENSGMSNDPITGLRRSFEEHASKVAFFALMAEHLIDDTYRLSQGDLGTLEFVSRYF